MCAAHQRLAAGILATATLVAAGKAQSMACVNDAPNPYQLVNDWTHLPRPLAPTNNVYVDAKDNVWVFDRCGDKGCAGSNVAPIWELSPDGKVLKNFGAGMFMFPHQVVPDTDGNVWLVDGQAGDGKGMQVTKLSSDGRVLMAMIRPNTASRPIPQRKALSTSAKPGSCPPSRTPRHHRYSARAKPSTGALSCPIVAASAPNSRPIQSNPPRVE